MRVTGSPSFSGGNSGLVSSLPEEDNGFLPLSCIPFFLRMSLPKRHHLSSSTEAKPPSGGDSCLLLEKSLDGRFPPPRIYSFSAKHLWPERNLSFSVKKTRFPFFFHFGPPVDGAPAAKLPLPSSYLLRRHRRVLTERRSYSASPTQAVFFIFRRLISTPYKGGMSSRHTKSQPIH